VVSVDEWPESLLTERMGGGGGSGGGGGGGGGGGRGGGPAAPGHKDCHPGGPEYGPKSLSREEKS
jgi:hypothetical protein